MDTNQLPKGQASETSRVKNKPGIYYHPGAKVQAITQPGNDGVLQADALVKVGYVRKGDTLSKLELKQMNEARAKLDAEGEK